jgi:putative aminopeptidase FrvX
VNQHELSLLFDLLHEPTAPFREIHIVRLATKILRQSRVPFFLDEAGNIVIGVASATEYKRLLAKPEREPLRLFVAHMDHPGFHGSRWLSDTRLHVTWHGGGPVKGLNGARVWLADEHGYAALGRMTKPKLDKTRRFLVDATIEIDRHARSAHPPATALFGGYGAQAPVWREGKLLYTKAADDLVGVFAIVRTALKLFSGKKTKRRAPFVGLLTRAEEVGFVGMIAHLEQGWFTRAKRRVVCVSLETSRTLPGADIGKGPVVRLGDRRTVFDPAYLRILTEAAQHALPGKHQRRIMDGGACEATAALAYGLPAIGISVPLGGYHNESFEPRTRGKPTPEYVHLDDVSGLLTLCETLMRPGLEWETPWKTTRDGFHKNFRKRRQLLT